MFVQNVLSVWKSVRNALKRKVWLKNKKGESRLREELKFMIFCEKHTFFKTTGESWQRENEQWRVGGGGRRWKWG